MRVVHFVFCFCFGLNFLLTYSSVVPPFLSLNISEWHCGAGVVTCLDVVFGQNCVKGARFAGILPFGAQVPTGFPRSRQDIRTRRLGESALNVHLVGYEEVCWMKISTVNVWVATRPFRQVYFARNGSGSLSVCTAFVRRPRGVLTAGVYLEGTD